MTREEAILCLKGIKNYGRDTFTEQSDWQNSLDMAIKALEQEPCEDCISRAQALSDYADWYGCGYSYNTFYEHLKNMPSIQPKTDVLDKIRDEIESCREDEVPHLCDYRYHRNEGLDMALDIIDKYKAESEDKE